MPTKPNNTVPLVASAEGIIWSHSKLNTAIDCSHKYYNLYPPLGFQKATTYRVSIGDGRVGSVVHDVLATKISGKSRNSTTEELIRRSGVKHDITFPELLRSLEFLGNIDKFVEDNNEWVERMGAKLISRVAEQKLAITKNFKLAKYWPRRGQVTPWMRGCVDLLAHVKTDSGSEVLVILDHKTGPPEMTTAVFEEQFRVYAVLATVLYPKVSTVLAQLHFPKTGEVIKRESTVSREQILDEFRPWLMDKVSRALDNIKDGRKAVRGPYCKYCNYQAKCPAMNTLPT